MGYIQSRVLLGVMAKNTQRLDHNLNRNYRLIH